MNDYSQICNDPASPLRLAALLFGYSAFTQDVAQKTISYHDLLEDEWQGRPSALEYLKKGTRYLQILASTHGAFAPQLRSQLHKERLNLFPIWSGIAAFLSKELSLLANLEECQDDTAEIDAQLITMVIQEMVYALQEASPLDTEKIVITARDITLTPELASRCRTKLAPGQYTALQLNNGEYNQDFLKNCIGAADFLIHATETDVPQPLQEAFLCWLGGARLHNGSIFCAKSGIQGGLLLLLPVANEPAPEDLRAHVKNGHPETILLVDDDDVIWDVVISMLKDLGYLVILAENGQDAVEIFRANPNDIDLVLLDMLMPVLNGREAFHQMKKINPQVKVLLASGYVNEEDARDVLENGAAGFLAKPYKIHDLAAKIRTILK